LHGFSYIPEQLIFRDYKNLNSDIYYNKRKTEYSNNISRDHFFDLSYETTGRFPVEHLNLMDKHI